MISRATSYFMVGALVLFAGTAQAVEIITVPVGNPGNAGEWSGESHGGYGPDWICGAVDYEYDIGKYEVTVSQYIDFLTAVAVTDAYGLYNANMWTHDYGCKIERTGLPGSYSYSAAVDLMNRPVNFVSWGDAARFANWLHNGQPTGVQDLTTTEDGAYYLNGAISDTQLLAVSREADWRWAIPTEDEWYKAAYHKNSDATGDYFDYPTSSDIIPGRDMGEAIDSGNNGNCQGDPYPIDSLYYTTVAGEFELSVSPYDTFDQGGNVWEWNETIILSDASRGLRGGSYANVASEMRASYRYDRADPTNEHRKFGFRVARIPEPSTLILLTTAALGLLAYAYRRRKWR